jgi:hypothetical protein
VLRENFDYFWLVVERCVVHNHQACRPERGQQHVFDPCCHGQMGTGCFEQHRSNPVFATLSHDEVGSLTAVAGYFAEDFSPSDRPAMRAMHIGLKTTLVKIDDVAPAMLGNPAAQLPKKCDSFLVTTFSVGGRFFL